MARKLRVLTQVMVVSLVLQTLAPQSALAFKPNEAGHLGITSTALRATQRVVSGETLTFSDRAIQQIRDANKDTDCLSCQANASLHFDDESFANATARLTNLKASVITKITASSPDGASARKDLGGALHTLQDFYAHSNWVELGNGSIDSRLGRSTYGGLPLSVATCPANSGTLGGSGLTSLTSGYFKIPLCDPPTGKCRHGIPFVCPSGLNKDEPSRTGYTSARALAVQASQDFLNQILDASGVAGNAKAIKGIMDIRSTLGMVIDTTGSMGGIIDNVKAQVAQIVNSVRGTDDEPSQYLLQAFSDPDVAGAFVTQDADAFLAAVNSLFADGGGDCPELSQTGLLRAVAASQSDARLYLFTDASSKDASLVGSVIAAAQAKQIQITPLLFGSCSPIDPAYVREAQETGGQLFFLSPSEAGLTFSLIRPQLKNNLVPVMSASGTLSGGSKEFPIPIDSSVQSATFSVSIDFKGPINLLRPSGVAVTSGDPGVTITELSSGRVVTVNAPETGLWRLQAGGSGSFTVEARANSALQFNSFEFVELTGRPAHEGLFPIAGQPVINTDETGLATLSGPFTTANFALVSQAGDTLQTVALAQGDPNAAADQFDGVFRPPAQPFRVVVSGLDQNGLPYQRLFSSLFRAQSVEVKINNTVSNLAAGSTTRLSFIAHNLGADGTFQILAADNRGFISSVQPASLTLIAGGSGNLSVDVSVPAGTPDGTDVSIAVTATSTSVPTITNSATQTLSVGGVTVDTTPPTITCPANVTAKSATINDPCVVVNFSATASDNLPGATVVCNPPSGSCFPVGTTTVTCTATDASGNTASCSFTVTAFNICLQDDSNPSIVFLGNTLTGAYRFCCGGTVFTGIAQVTRQGNIATFQHNAGGRRVLAKDDEGVFKGTASLQSPPGTTICTITDRDTRNNSCVCQ